MRAFPSPKLHVFVCANRREGSPLGPGCGERGDAVYDALKREVAARGAVSDTWITKTHCLGVCPRRGATVARYPSATPIVAEVEPSDAADLLTPTTASPYEEVARAIDALEALQRDKVLELARRLRPGLTLEDVQNPHDFPELADPDWQYADGVAAGIASVKSAVLAIMRRTRNG